MIKRDKSKTIEEQIFEVKEHGYTPEYVGKCLGVQSSIVASIWIGRYFVGKKNHKCKELLLEGCSHRETMEKLNVSTGYVSQIFNQMFPVEKEVCQYKRDKRKQVLNDEIMEFRKTHTQKETCAKFNIGTHALASLEKKYDFSKPRGRTKDGFTQIG